MSNNYQGIEDWEMKEDFEKRFDDNDCEMKEDFEKHFDDNDCEMEIEQPEQPNELTVEELPISCAQARPAIWNSRLPFTQRSEHITGALWMEIYAKIEVEVLKKLWRNLQDNYVRLKQENESYVSSGSASKKTKCPYFQQMMFLNETISNHATTSNLKSTDAEGGSVEALNKINVPTPPVPPERNLICQRISEILPLMPLQQRLELEMELSQVVLERVENYL